MDYKVKKVCMSCGRDCDQEVYYRKEPTGFDFTGGKTHKIIEYQRCTECGHESRPV